METKSFFQSRGFKIALYIIGGLLIFLIIFQAGMFMGYRRAAFTYKWGDDYYRNFGGKRGGFMMMNIPREDFFNPNGTVGKVIKVSLPTLTVLGNENVEKTVLIKSDTAIIRFRDQIKSSDIKVDDNVVVIGSPNEQSQIEAKLIRIMPDTSFMPMMQFLR